MRRYRSLELLRGFGVVLMVFLHGAVYQYAGLFQIDFSHPPMIVTIIGFLLMWSGLFAMLSGATHVIRMSERLERGIATRVVLRWELISAAGFLVLGLLYFTLVGPSILDFSERARENSLAVGFIRDGSLEIPGLSRWIYMNTLFMIGFSTLVAGPLFLRLIRERDPHSTRERRIVALAALLVFAVSWLRIPLFPVFEQAQAERNYAFVIGTFWLLNKHDPLWPALGFTLCGTLFGLTLLSPPRPSRMALPLSVGVLLLAAGVSASLFAPDTMLQRSIDWTWYAMMLTQGGVIIIGLAAAHRWLDRYGDGNGMDGLVARTLTRFSRASLTVLFGETVIAESASRIMSAVAPGWNLSLFAALVFGVASATAWAVILGIWERSDYRYSVEWAWVRILGRLGRPSTKLSGRLEGEGHAAGTASGHR